MKIIQIIINININIIIIIIIILLFLDIRDGKFGFYLNENLIDGYISPCMTFNYNSDIIENENFECYGLEIWGFEF